MPDTQPQPDAKHHFNALWVAVCDAIGDAYATAVYDPGRLAFAFLDALNEHQPVVVAQWYAEHHPQPERVYGPPFIERYPEPERDTIGQAVRDSVGDPEYAYRYALDPNKPQPERDTEQQRDTVAHAYAVGLDTGVNVATLGNHIGVTFPGTHSAVYAEGYDTASDNPERLLAEAYPKQHAAARKRHTDPKQD